VHGREIVAWSYWNSPKTKVQQLIAKETTVVEIPSGKKWFSRVYIVRHSIKI